MVRSYKRKSTRQTWDEEAMKAAIKAVTNNGLGLKKASAEFSVPKATLRRRVKGLNKSAIGAAKLMGNFKTTFPEEIEKDHVDYIHQMELMMYGLTSNDLRRLAFQLTERNGIAHQFNREKQMAGKDWLYSFIKRHPISLRQPEATSAARARSFNHTNVNKFFDLLEPLMDKHKFPPNNIYNVDETGISTVQSKPSKVLAKTGRKQVGSLVSAERGQTVTVETCMSVTGSFIPPMFILPRVRMKMEH
eukprot:XP_011680207.1 PREDICTED: uncharacterized protein LOC105445837 [Strongylocentrotus purpuratus]